MEIFYSVVVILLVIMIAVGSLFFFLGYGILFIAAFSKHKKFSVIVLILLGFSGVLLVLFGIPWYYSMPLWLLPPLYPHFWSNKDKHLKMAIYGLWLGLILFAIGVGVFGYYIYEYADPSVLEKLTG